MSKGKTIGELLEEARKKSGAPKLAGHDIMDLERFAPDTRHMIVFDVFSHESPFGFKDNAEPPGKEPMPWSSEENALMFAVSV